MPSGVVFVAILVIWAAILAPQAVKLYERSAAERSPQRFRTAMGVLGTGRVVPPVSIESTRRVPSVKISRRRALGDVGGGSTVMPQPEAVPTSVRRAMERRRQVALSCAAIAGIVAVLAIAGLVPAWAVMAGVVPLSAYLGLCALTAPQRLHARATRAGQAGSVRRADSEAPLRDAHQNSLAPRPRMLPLLARRSIEASTADEPPTDMLAATLPRPTFRRRRIAGPEQAQMAEVEAALAATYSSAEEKLGLDRYVASPSDIDGRPYLRAANE